MPRQAQNHQFAVFTQFPPKQVFNQRTGNPEFISRIEQTGTVVAKDLESAMIHAKKKFKLNRTPLIQRCDDDTGELIYPDSNYQG